MAGGKGSSKSQITGYRYKMAVQMGISRGPLNELCEIRVGDLVAWTGSVTSGGMNDIDKPNLFGGDQKEGGIVGWFRMFMGEATQTIDSIILDNIEGGFPVPGWRGVATLFYYGQIGANNPYPKSWKMRVRRTTMGWDNDAPWYAAKCKIEITPNPLATVNFTSNPVAGNSINIGSVVLGFAAVGDATHVAIGADATATATTFRSHLNTFSVDYYDAVATGTGTQTDIEFSSTGILVSEGSGNFMSVLQSGGGIHAMNPAHIIYECVTNNVWGRGLSTTFIDDASFRTAADTLFDEGLGLCLRWNRQDDIDKFVQTVVNHIGAVLHIDRNTGLLTLKLIRDDYVAADLIAFTFESGLIDITDDQSTSSDTTFNEIIVKYNDPLLDKIGQVRVQNLASFQSIGTLISTSVEYLGASTPALALRLAQRDLQMQSSDLRRVTVKMDRNGWKISPGDVFKISAPTRGIQDMILRAGKIEDSPLDNGEITISAVQDIFSLPDASFVTPQPTFWVAPNRSARVVETRLLTEATYFDLAENLPATELAAIPVEDGAIKVFAKQPNGAAISYSLATEAAGETAYVERSTAGWDAGAVLTATIGYYATSLVFEDSFFIDTVSVGDPLLIDDEYIRIDAINIGTSTLTIARGCIDTIPATHNIGATIWFQTAAPTTDFREYTSSELVHAKLLTMTTSDKLSLAVAPVDDITITGRQGRPYPPGNLRVDGNLVFDVLIDDGDLVFTWAHRDRIVQGNFLLEHGAASTGPEPGTTYTFRVFDGSDPVPTTLLRTVSGIALATWTYTDAMRTADGDLASYWFTVQSVRDGIVSHQFYKFKIGRSPEFGEAFDDDFDGGGP